MINMLAVKSLNKAEKSAKPVSDSSEKEPKLDEFTALLDGLFAVPVLPNNLPPPSEKPAIETAENSIALNLDGSENTNATNTTDFLPLQNITSPKNLPLEINNFLPIETKSKIDWLSKFNLAEKLTSEKLAPDFPNQNLDSANKILDSLEKDGLLVPNSDANLADTSFDNLASDTNLADKPFEILTVEANLKTPEKNIFSDKSLFEPALALDAKKSESADKLPKLFGEVGGLLEIHNPNLFKASAISETTASPNAEKAFIEQIEPRLLELAGLTMQTGEKQILKMRLHPAELGMVEIRVEKSKSGKITAHFQTETESAKQILTANVEQLRDSLQKAGWQVEQMEISADSNTSSNGSEDRENHTRQTETAENTAVKANNFDGNSENKGDLRENKLNRLLSLRA